MEFKSAFKGLTQTHSANFHVTHTQSCNAFNDPWLKLFSIQH